MSVHKNSTLIELILRKDTYIKVYISPEKKNICKKYTLSQHPRKDCATHQRKWQVFKKLSWVSPRSKLSIEDDMKIHQGELTNVLLSLKNIYTWLHPTHRNGWIRFKCQKNLAWNFVLSKHPIFEPSTEDNIYPNSHNKSSHCFIYDIRNKQICKTINIARHLVSLFHFLTETMDKVYNNQPYKHKKINSTLLYFITLSWQKPWLSSLSGTQEIQQQK